MSGPFTTTAHSELRTSPWMEVTTFSASCPCGCNMSGSNCVFILPPFDHESIADQSAPSLFDCFLKSKASRSEGTTSHSLTALKIASQILPFPQSKCPKTLLLLLPPSSSPFSILVIISIANFFPFTFNLPFLPPSSSSFTPALLTRYPEPDSTSSFSSTIRSGTFCFSLPSAVRATSFPVVDVLLRYLVSQFHRS